MRALIPREGSAPVRDRLLMTLFLAALIHGVIILGLTFAGSGPPDRGARGLDVLLVSDELPTAARNDSAAYLAQRTQLGSGNTSGPAAAHNQPLEHSPPVHPGDAQGTTLSSTAAAAERPEEQVLTTLAARTDVRYFTANQSQAGDAREQPLAADGPTKPRPADSERGAVQLRGAKRDELWVTPDTQESILAPYLDSWRQRVERIGTLNYPTAAQRAGVQASLLKLASPFDPFPPDLAARYHTLRFAYEWQFTGGRVARGAVTAVP
jgi:protein TonB